jgi:phage terminase large subunit
MANQDIHVSFDDLANVSNDKYYPLFWNKKPWLVLMGGAMSGKSVFAADKVVKRVICEPNHKILCLRKVGATIRYSSFAQVLDTIRRWNMETLFSYNKSDMTITCLLNDNQIIFSGLDDSEKLKSITNITSIWVEEATEFSAQDLVQVDLRLRGRTKSYKQIILTFNPISRMHHLKKRFFDKHDPRSKVLITTFLDNKFLDQSDIDKINDLKHRDIEYYEIYGLAQWGDLTGIIYAPPTLLASYPDSFDEIIYGLDFNYSLPMGLCRYGLKDGAVYVEQLVYRPGLTTKDLIDMFPSFGIKSTEPIYCDSAEPDRIETIYRAGYNAHPANKGPGSVRAGIDFVKTLEIYSHESNIDYNNEKETYKWKVDKNKNPLDEPLKEHDHLMDGERYALWTHLGKPRQKAFIS